MAEKAPEFTIANNPYCFLHCGPVGPDDEDDGRDFTLITAANNHLVYSDNGNKVEHVQGTFHEVTGHSIDPDQKEVISRSIVARNGDIIISAERGTISLKAKNIHLETTGEKGEGNFLVGSNGYIILASTEEVRIAGSRICINGTAGVNVVSGNFINMSGDMKYFGPVGALSTIKNLLAGNWGNLIEGLTNSCGKTGAAL